jgi:O-antigen ligase
VFGGLAAFLVVDRLVPDLFVLPVGFSLKASQAMVLLLGIALMWALIVEPRPFPLGVGGALGLASLGILVVAPLTSAPNLTLQQLDAAERGIVSILLLSGLFIASYYIGFDRTRSVRLIVLAIGLTAAQAALAYFEKLSGILVAREWSVFRLGFLIPDPGLDRGIGFVSFRAGGLRPAATAPHPIVLSALIALAMLLIVALYPLARRHSRRLLAALVVPLALGLFSLTTRTGFVILGVGGLAVGWLVGRRWTDHIVRLLLLATGVVIVVVAVSPGSARALLDLFSRVGSDPSLAARTADFAVFPELLAENPLLGGGYMTHLPTVRIFDNSYLVGLIEFGVVGFAVLFSFLVAATMRPALAFSMSDDRETPLLVSGVVGGVALLAGMATFDALKFAQFLPTVILLLGIGLSQADQVFKRSRGVVASA